GGGQCYRANRHFLCPLPANRLHDDQMRHAMNLRDFFRLGIIVPALPNQIMDGQIIDAVPVMQNFQAIVDAVNANAQPLAGAVGTVPVYVPVVGGTANAITLTPVSPISSYAAGQTFTFI